MTIGFDAKRLFLNYTGLGNYSRFVVEALVESYPENLYKLFSPALKQNPDTIYFLNNERIKVIDPKGWLLPKSMWRSAGVSFSEEIKTLDLYHGLSAELPFFLPKKIKKVVTVHDLIFIRYPEYYHLPDRKIYKEKLKYACENSDLIIAISQQTANDLLEFINVPKEKVRVVYQGCHRQFSERLRNDVIKSILNKYNIEGDYILTVGTIEPRKNLITLLEAYSKISEENRPQLVAIGRKTFPYFDQVVSTVKRLKLESSVKFIHGIQFVELPAFYQGAKAFIYPSQFEGFGIPIIEAIMSGVPVITSKGSCFIEAGGPDLLYADPNSAEEFSTLIQKTLADSTFSKDVVSKSSDYIKRFSQEEIAKNVMSVYHEIL